MCFCFFFLMCVHLCECGCVFLYASYRKVIWNICPKLTCWVLLLYPCSISPNRVSLKWTSCLGHFGPSQFSDCRRQERPSPASLYSCTHLRERDKLSIQCTIFEPNGESLGLDLKKEKTYKDISVSIYNN